MPNALDEQAREPDIFSVNVLCTLELSEQLKLDVVHAITSRAKRNFACVSLTFLEYWNQSSLINRGL
jgi:hypothetical protein